MPHLRSGEVCAATPHAPGYAAGGHVALSDIYDLLVAGRYADAQYDAALRELPESVGAALAEGRFQDAICDLETRLHPASRCGATALNASAEAVRYRAAIARRQGAA